MSKKIKTIEEPEGTGYVYEHERQLATVKYHLYVTQDYYVERDEEILGLKGVRGTIEITEGPADLELKSDGLILHLEDGRKIGFMISRMDPFSCQHHITCSGGDI